MEDLRSFLFNVNKKQAICENKKSGNNPYLICIFVHNKYCKVKISNGYETKDDYGGVAAVST